MDPLDQRTASYTPRPLSVADRERATLTQALLAREATDAKERAQTATHPAEELRWSERCALAAGTLAELRRRRGL
jgi:hypothetical protein